MTLRHLKVFAALSRSESLTAASVKLGISQPAVSRALSELEAEYGVKLFERPGHRLHLTDSGAELLKYAEIITSEFESMKLAARMLAAKNTLDVGASITVGSVYMPVWLKRFKEESPDADVRVKVASSDRLEQMVIDLELDFAVIEGKAHQPDIEIRELYGDSLCAVRAGNFPPETMTAAQVAALPLLLREKGSGTRELVDAAFGAAGAAVSPTLESTDTTALINAAAAGLGVAIIPKRLAEPRIKAGDVVEIAVTGVDLRRRFVVTRHKKKTPSKEEARFIEIVSKGEHIGETAE